MRNVIIIGWSGRDGLLFGADVVREDWVSLFEAAVLCDWVSGDLLF